MEEKHIALVVVSVGIIVALVLILGQIPVTRDEGELIDEWQCTKTGTEKSMHIAIARLIARQSGCTEEGTLSDDYFCNRETGTIWIDLNIEKSGCNPACVINVVTEEAEINWRCTGLVE